MAGSAAHLFHRFFDVLFARALDERERDEVATWLTDPLADLFFSQPGVDQRHAYAAAQIVIDRDDAHEDAVVAALTHDVAKRHARLGILGRTFASILMKTGVHLSDRMAAYRDHGHVGAIELRNAGAPSLAVDFAMHHHGARPSSISEEVWDVLMAADQPPKAWASLRRGISSRRE